jgi:hypothetical protein
MDAQNPLLPVAGLIKKPSRGPGGRPGHPIDRHQAVVDTVHVNGTVDLKLKGAASANAFNISDSVGCRVGDTVWVLDDNGDLLVIGAQKIAKQKYTFNANFASTTLNFDQGHENVKVYWQVVAATSGQIMRVQFNGVSTASYRHSFLYSTNGAASSGDNGNTASGQARLGYAPVAGNPGSSGCLEIVGYTTTGFPIICIVREGLADANTSSGEGTIIFTPGGAITSMTTYLDGGVSYHQASKFWVEYS